MGYGIGSGSERRAHFKDEKMADTFYSHRLIAFSSAVKKGTDISRMYLRVV